LYAALPKRGNAVLTHEELASITSGGHTLMMGAVYYASSKWKLQKKQGEDVR